MSIDSQRFWSQQAPGSISGTLVNQFAAVFLVIGRPARGFMTHRGSIHGQYLLVNTCCFILHGPSWTAQRTSCIVIRAVSAYSSSGAPGSGTNYALPSRAMFARCFAYAFLNPSRVLNFFMSLGTLFQPSVLSWPVPGPKTCCEWIRSTSPPPQSPLITLHSPLGTYHSSFNNHSPISAR